VYLKKNAINHFFQARCLAKGNFTLIGILLKFFFKNKTAASWLSFELMQVF
jgi:hypothetical protein